MRGLSLLARSMGGDGAALISADSINRYLAQQKADQQQIIDNSREDARLKIAQELGQAQIKREQANTDSLISDRKAIEDERRRKTGLENNADADIMGYLNRQGAAIPEGFNKSAPRTEISPEEFSNRFQGERNKMVLPSVQFGQESGMTGTVATDKAKEFTDILQRQESMDAAEQARKDAAELRKWQTEENAKNRAAAKSVELNNKDADKYYNAQNDLSQRLNSSRSQMGLLVGTSNRATRELGVLDKAISGDVVPTVQLWRELNTGFNTILGGSNAVSQIDELTATSAAQELKNKLQYATDHPEAAVSKEWLKALRHSIYRVANVSQSTLNKMVDAEVKAKGHYLSEESKGALQSYADDFVKGLAIEGGEGEAEAPVSELPADKAKRLAELRAKRDAGTLGK